MKLKDPIKEILIAARPFWDHPGTRSSVRGNFQRMIDCRTSALGAEIYASATEEKVGYHTCKSRACPSCGHRATLLWQRELWASLPDIRYAGIVFTMPDVLWPIFQRNRHLLHDLPALGAAVIKQWVKIKFGVEVLITASGVTQKRPCRVTSKPAMLEAQDRSFDWGAGSLGWHGQCLERSEATAGDCAGAAGMVATAD